MACLLLAESAYRSPSARLLRITEAPLGKSRTGSSCPALRPGLTPNNLNLNRNRPRPLPRRGPRQFGQEDQIMPTLFDPFEQLREFQRAIDAFRSSGWLGAGLSAGGAYPPINVFRKGDDIVAIIEVPGVRKSDLDIRIERNTLPISGSKSVEYGDKAATHRRERAAGGSIAP